MKELVNNIKNADLVLVGIGEEFVLKKNEEKTFEEQIQDRKEGYQVLANLLEGKNYFCVTLCNDHLLNESGLDEHRIVDPCGNLWRVQCEDKCSNEIQELQDEYKDQLKRYLAEEDGISKLQDQLGQCPKCGKKLVFNIVGIDSYNEEGYLDQWNLYTKWLQGTVNKKVCILELGVGMKYPTVIRWPFEKVTFFNQKATMYRVHSRLFQKTEEIKDRCTGIQADPVQFLKQLSNQI